MISQQQENSGRNYKDHIFCDQQSDHHSKAYKKQHKAYQLFQFSCTFSLVCYSLCKTLFKNETIYFSGSLTGSSLPFPDVKAVKRSTKSGTMSRTLVRPS